MNYYNDFDPNACAWLEGLIEAKEIPPGKVDNRSITDVTASDLLGFVQCHFFAGIGGWPLALRLAGVPSTRRLWSASCPCPPFSSAGKTKLCPECGGKPIPHPLKTGIFACIPCGHEWLADGRHLYPELHRLIVDRRPPVVFGEQVVGTDGLVWLSGIRATLEAASYGVGAADLCSAGQASPNIRQRLYWVADACGSEWHGDIGNRNAAGCGGSADDCADGRMADTGRGECGGEDLEGSPSGKTPIRNEKAVHSGRRGEMCGLGHSSSTGSQGYHREGDNGNQPGREHPQSLGSTGAAGGPAGGLEHADMHGCEQGHGSTETARHGASSQPANFWADSYAIKCSDGKFRRVPTEPALFPLADGLPYKLARRGSIRPALLKGAGNAINPYVAAQFIRAFYDVKSAA